mmetsp:Transcript_19264/g.68047  ORF Transcript_19264/g.68047 Transcript_19264/m.68047 type:complete len:426 (+) Transcript_19264:929-2206(+)
MRHLQQRRHGLITVDRHHVRLPLRPHAQPQQLLLVVPLLLQLQVLGVVRINRLLDGLGHVTLRRRLAGPIHATVHQHVGVAGRVDNRLVLVVLRARRAAAVGAAAPTAGATVRLSGLAAICGILSGVLLAAASRRSSSRRLRCGCRGRRFLLRQSRALSRAAEGRAQLVLRQRLDVRVVEAEPVAGLEVLDVGKVVPAVRGAGVVHDAEQLVLLRQRTLAVRSGWAPPAGVERRREGNRVVHLDAPEGAHVEGEALQLQRQDFGQLLDAHALARVRLVPTPRAVVLVVTAQLVGRDVVVERLLDRRAALDLQQQRLELVRARALVVALHALEVVVDDARLLLADVAPQLRARARRSQVLEEHAHALLHVLLLESLRARPPERLGELARRDGATRGALEETEQPLQLQRHAHVLVPVLLRGVRPAV